MHTSKKSALRNGLRRSLWNSVTSAGVALLVGLSFRPCSGEDLPPVVHAAYNTWGVLSSVRAHKGFDQRLAAIGVKVDWIEFPAGPQFLEALNVGSVSFGESGEAPPIFAQAAGSKIVYLAHEPANPWSEAILVPKDSPIHSLADLKGKKVATNKASNTHYFLVKALESAGLKFSDIEPVYLSPPDALAAFQGGNIDAWAIWQPYQGIAEAQGARLLADGTGLVSNYGFYIGSRDFAEKYPTIVAILKEEIAKIDAQVQKNPDGLIAELGPQVRIPPPILKSILSRQHWGVEEITPDIVAYQQQIADTFLKLGLIPAPVVIQDAVLATPKITAAH
ncbi:MAG TPA: aliphatic sulfonate ABC transporter substrate-binding protein [Candidatus Methylacidiphilales bacterium]